jgi:inosine-uridine nucleoside N-ribohydrolase
VVVCLPYFHNSQPLPLSIVLLVLCGLPVLPSSRANSMEPNEPIVPRKILFDTDPGGDDIFALLWLQSLAKQGYAEIVAVTTTGGNVESRRTFDNAARILAQGGFGDIEVGRSAAVDRHEVDAAYIHGEDGVGGLSKDLRVPAQGFDEARSSAEIIVEHLQAQPGQITLVAVGPLTNLAAAESQCPGILAKAKELVIMGGVFRQKGNITPQAEFNIFCDPEAADKVLSSHDRIVVLPLDVTTQIRFTIEHARAIRETASGGRLAEFIHGLTRFLIRTTMSYRATEGAAAFHVHDAATLAYLFYPETLLLRRGHVRVETLGRWTRGQTVLDERHGAKTKANAWVALEVDVPNLLAVLSEDLKWLCGQD